MITEIKKIKQLFNQEDIGPVFFVSPNPNRAIGIEKEIENYHIICSQNMDIIDSLRKEKISVFCVDKKKIKNSGKLLENKKVLRYIQKEANGKTANIITFKPSPKISKICADNNFRYLGNDWKLNKQFEDKIEFVYIANELKISNAKSKVVEINKGKMAENIFGRLAEKSFVFQLARGFSGNSTFLIKNKEDFQKVIEKYKERQFKVSEYLRGDTYTINACTTKFGIAVSQPIFQITGLTDYNKNELGTSGNDYSYSEKLGDDEKKKIFDYTKKIGEYMAQSGYQGIFGLDFVVSKNDVNLIEINPRFVGSIPVFTKLQLQREEVPFILLHLLEFLKIDYQSELSRDYFSFDSWNKQDNFHFSQLILRNTNDIAIKIKRSMTSGIYKIKNNKLVLKNKNCSAKGLEEDEILIQATPKGSLINPDVEYANIQFPCGIIKENKLNKIYKKKIDLILGSFDL
ncbi:ATP-grasp domain-containing protein [Candidatus Parcubacteria bacterium]|nr:ATP-grasp domain-containing protein [Candidatus Parcubacteria bacterium]